jgi:hypothetical protein
MEGKSPLGSKVTTVQIEQYLLCSYSNRNYPRVRERKAPGRAPAGRAAGIALGRAGFWGQRPQILLNVGAHTNEQRLFDSAEHSVGRARADDAAPPILQEGRIGRRVALCRRPFWTITLVMVQNGRRHTL